jgi:hypothetical protein
MSQTLELIDPTRNGEVYFTVGDRYFFVANSGDAVMPTHQADGHQKGTLIPVGTSARFVMTELGWERDTMPERMGT